nr:hypothetical protein [Mucilaginibacter sp. E4BP6]
MSGVKIDLNIKINSYFWGVTYGRALHSYARRH